MSETWGEVHSSHRDLIVCYDIDMSGTTVALVDLVTHPNRAEFHAGTQMFNH